MKGNIMMRQKTALLFMLCVAAVSVWLAPMGKRTEANKAVYFQFITSSSEFIQKTGCQSNHVTVVSTAHPGDEDNWHIYLCGDFFGCSSIANECYDGKHFK